MRRIAVILHRWAGLFMAGFLILSGLTGSVIAFNLELDRWLNPDVLTIEPTDERLPVAAWIDSAEEAYPNARVIFVTVPQANNEPATLFLVPRTDPQTDRPLEVVDNVDQAFVHPGTGALLGARDRDGFRLDRLHAMPFIYQLHFTLHLGQWGMWLFGGIAILWFFDCFVGLYLAWPRRTWEAVKRALTVKWRASATRVNYDLHRAGGLWVWVVLAVLAFSGFSMNLHEELFDPMMEAVAPMTEWPGEVAPTRDDPGAPMPMTVAEAVALGERGLSDGGLEGPLGAVWLNHLKGMYHLGYHTPQDLMHEHPGAWVSIAAAEREVVDVRPAGGYTVGDAVHDWQFPLHSGKAFGLTGRIIISATGLVVAMLSVTGVIIWWKKRRAGFTRRRSVDGLLRDDVQVWDDYQMKAKAEE